MQLLKKVVGLCSSEHFKQVPINSTGENLKTGLLEEIQIAMSTSKIQNPTGRDRNFDSERHRRKKVKRESVTSPKVYGI